MRNQKQPPRGFSITTALLMFSEFALMSVHMQSNHTSYSTEYVPVVLVNCDTKINNGFSKFKVTLAISWTVLLFIGKFRTPLIWKMALIRNA